MHNGGIAEFGKLKRRLQAALGDELFGFPQGNTGEFCASALSKLVSTSGDRFGVGVRVVLVNGE